MVRIQGEDIAVRARVRSLDIYSGHADAAELTGWAKARRPVAGKVFLAHGEPDALEAMRERLVREGFPAESLVVPAMDGRYRLAKASATALEGPTRMAPLAAGGLDWHNDRSRLLLELNRRLENLPSDAERAALLARLSGELGVDEGQGRASRAVACEVSAPRRNRHVQVPHT